MSAQVTVPKQLLTKTADYIDALETRNRELEAAQQSHTDTRVDADAQKLAEQYTNATGEDLDPDLARKIAAYDDEDFQKVLHKLASPEQADTLGAPQRDRNKVASDGDAAWDRFGNFVMAP